jgi:hypothetical protein
MQLELTVAQAHPNEDRAEVHGPKLEGENPLGTLGLWPVWLLGRGRGRQGRRHRLGDLTGRPSDRRPGLCWHYERLYPRRLNPPCLDHRLLRRISLRIGVIRFRVRGRQGHCRGFRALGERVRRPRCAG